MSDPSVILNIQSEAELREFLSLPHGSIQFYAHWCPHCTNLKPAYSTMAESLHDVPVAMVDITKVDVNDTTFAGEPIKQIVTGFPTIFFFKNGPTGTTKELVKERHADMLVGAGKAYFRAPALSGGGRRTSMKYHDNYAHDNYAHAATPADDTLAPVDTSAPVDHVQELMDKYAAAGMFPEGLVQRFRDQQQHMA